MDKLGIVLIGFVVVGVLMIGYSLWQLNSSPVVNTPANYQRALAAQLPDKCATPPGYTDAQWREHWGHHPDQYRECLNAIGAN